MYVQKFVTRRAGSDVLAQTCWLMLRFSGGTDVCMYTPYNKIESGALVLGWGGGVGRGGSIWGVHNNPPVGDVQVLISRFDMRRCRSKFHPPRPCCEIKTAVQSVPLLSIGFARP